MSMDPLDQLLAYQAALEGIGLRAVIDGRDVNPPCVLLRPPSLRYRFGRGCVGADWEARLYLTDAGQANALKAALPLLVHITDAIPAVTATPADYALPDGGTAVGFTLTWSTN